MMRVEAFAALGGYREDVIAAEEDELCLRMRRTGWHIWRIDADMAVHDAAMMHFRQWWRRAYRCGYAYAQGAYLHGRATERHFVWESRRALIWGIWLPVACLLSGLVFGLWGLASLLIYPLQFVRQIMRNKGPPGQRVSLALFQVLAHFPEGLGQIKFLRDTLLGNRARLIEHK